MDSTFYQFQLGLLAVICTVFLVFERYLKSKKSTTANLKELSVEENLEVGHSTLPSNGAAVPAITPRAGALSTLMQKYLLVYAIVMGKVVLIMFFEGVDPFQRCRLAARPICLLSLSRAIRLPRTASRRVVCHWLHERRHLCTACWRLGGHIVSTYLALVRGRFLLLSLHSGRKRICLLFCVLYAATCGLLLFPFFPVLLLARVFGGISTSILFSAFESWLVSSSSSAALHSEDLSTIMGRATLVNGFVATAAGVCCIAVGYFSKS